MDLLELQRRLYAARRGGVKLDLGRTEALLERLGRPERWFRSAIIGGTNGKGSTAAFVASIASEERLRVGLFTSPHLTRFTERFVIDGAEIGERALLESGAAVESAAQRMGAAGEPTFFERVTAIALHAFAAAGVDLAVLEVGMGGRFDATNAVDAQVRAVTGVAIDHTEYLGRELSAIVREKAGIFAAERVAVIGRSGEPEGARLLVEAARAAGAHPIEVVGERDLEAIADWPLGLPGRMQRANAACAVAVARALGLRRRVARRRGLERARLPGRLERLSDRPAIWVDGAHNAHAARALAAEPAIREGAGRLVLVLGISEGKDAAGIAAALAPLADAAVVTRSRNARAMDPEVLSQALADVKPDLPVERTASVAEALALARRRAGTEDRICCCGSLFVVGEAREACGLAVPDPLELSDPV